MASPRERYISRRKIMKRAGIGGAAGVIGVAGCLGGGGDGDGDGDIEDRDTLRLVIPPLGYNMVALQHIRENTDILDTEMESVGYDYDITVSWDDSTLFAGGQADTVPTLGDVESAQIAAERDMELTFHGLCATNYEGIYVRRGSEMDPENTGSVEETIRKAAEEDIPYGNAGWNQGEVVACQPVYMDKYGIEYTEDGDLNIHTSDWFTLPSLLVDGEVDIIVNAPPLGAAPQVAQEEPPIKDILWYQPGLEDVGLDARTLNLGVWPTTQEFSEHHDDALAAFMGAWVEGIEYLDDPSNYDEIVSDDDLVDALGGNNEEEARVILEFGQQPGSHTEAPDGGNTEPIMLSDIELDDEFIEADMEAMRAVADEPFNMIPDGWEDRIEFKKLSL